MQLPSKPNSTSRTTCSSPTLQAIRHLSMCFRLLACAGTISAINIFTTTQHCVLINAPEYSMQKITQRLFVNHKLLSSVAHHKNLLESTADPSRSRCCTCFFCKWTQKCLLSSHGQDPPAHKCGEFSRALQAILCHHLTS